MPSPQPSRNVALGIALMLGAMLLFSLNDVLGKWLVSTYAAGQVLLIRSLAALAAMVVFMAAKGGAARLVPSRPGIQALRVLFSTAEGALFYWSVAYLPLADVLAYWMAGPVWVVAISALLLGEKVDLKRWMAVLTAFIGIIVALNPSAPSWGLPVLAAIAGSVCFAALIVTGRMLQGTADLTLVFWQNAGAGLFAGAIAIGHWVAPSWLDLALLSTLGLVAMLGHLGVTRSLKLAPASMVAPYQYSLIVWGVVFGYAVFGDVPAPNMLGGASLIVAAGLALFVLERRAGKTAEVEDPV